jgi:hypothetical protein
MHPTFVVLNPIACPALSGLLKKNGGLVKGIGDGLGNYWFAEKC